MNDFEHLYMETLESRNGTFQLFMRGGPHVTLEYFININYTIGLLEDMWMKTIKMLRMSARISHGDIFLSFYVAQRSLAIV